MYSVLQCVAVIYVCRDTHDMSCSVLQSHDMSCSVLQSCLYLEIYTANERVMSCMRHIKHMNMIGSPKLQIIFHKRATTYRALLRKMTYKDKGSYESSPPCMTHMFVWHIWNICHMCESCHIICLYMTWLISWRYGYVAVCISIYIWHIFHVCHTNRNDSYHM